MVQRLHTSQSVLIHNEVINDLNVLQSIFSTSSRPQQTCDRLTGVINSITAEHFILHQVPVIYRADSRVFGMIGGRG